MTHLDTVLAQLPSDECVIWPGKLGDDGYGQHRLVWSKVMGQTAPGRAEGMTLDHLCRNRGCVNPAHLEVVSHRENVLRGNTVTGINARKTHCVHGHEFSLENTYVNPQGRRRCRICLRKSVRDHYAKYPERRIPNKKRGKAA